jgi:hypothetical protein
VPNQPTIAEFHRRMATAALSHKFTAVHEAWTMASLYEAVETAQVDDHVYLMTPSSINTVSGC